MQNESDKQSQSKHFKCLRCGNVMESHGIKGFHEGFGSGAFVVDFEYMEMWVCPTCGKVELFSAEN